MYRERVLVNIERGYWYIYREVTSIYTERVLVYIEGTGT